MWFGSASQVTVPELPTRMNLYCTWVPGVSETVHDQSGLLLVYCDALRLTASSVSQLPRAEMLPALSALVSMEWRSVCGA